MSATPARGIPYQGETEAETARRQRVATGPLTLVQGGAAAFTPSAVRRPGKHMHPELRAQLEARAAARAESASPEAAPEVLRQVIDGLAAGSRQDAEPQPAARGAEPLYAEALAAHQRNAAHPEPEAAPEAAPEPVVPAAELACMLPGTPAPVEGPLPLPAAAPAQPPADAEPMAAVAVPEGLRDYLRTLAGWATLGIAALIARDGLTPELCEQAGRNARLGDALLYADDSDAALRALIAEGGRA